MVTLVFIYYIVVALLLLYQVVVAIRYCFDACADKRCMVNTKKSVESLFKGSCRVENETFCVIERVNVEKVSQHTVRKSDRSVVKMNDS